MNRRPHDPRLPLHARGTMVAAGLLAGAATLVFTASAYSAFGDGALTRLAFAHSLAAFVVAAVAMLLPRLTLPFVLASEVILVGPYFAEVWLRHVALVQSQLMFAPFQGLKLVMLALAVVVPAPVWVHLVWLAGFGALAAGIWWAFDLAALPPQLLIAEPWFTVMFWVASVGLLLIRWRSESLARRLLASEAQSHAFSGVARLFLRMRDETNTPLQNIRLGVELLARRHPEDAEIIGRIDAALARLEKTRTALGRYDHLVQWNGTELNADAELEALLVEIERQEARDDK